MDVVNIERLKAKTLDGRVWDIEQLDFVKKMATLKIDNCSDWEVTRRIDRATVYFKNFVLFQEV